VKTKTLLLLVGLLGLVPVARSLAAAARAHEAVETYYADGSLKSRIETEAGRPDGRCVRFYPDGTRMAEGRFEDGREQGRWVFYTPDGTVDAERSGVYQDGRRVSGS
jgi:antitoxin component YwqK of YwqJK toxin-antitoxin module